MDEQTEVQQTEVQQPKADLRGEIHNAWARVREDSQVYHADVENTLLIITDMVNHGVLSVRGA